MNHRGLTPLTLAIMNQNEELVEYLLTVKGIHLGDALLHAVDQNNLDILELLIQWKEE